MHVVDDVHRLVVNPCYRVENLLVILHYLIEVEEVAAERLDAVNHESTCVLAASAVDCKKQRLCEVGTCAEELDGFTDGLI